MKTPSCPIARGLGVGLPDVRVASHNPVLARLPPCVALAQRVRGLRHARIVPGRRWSAGSSGFGSFEELAKVIGVAHCQNLVTRLDVVEIECLHLAFYLGDELDAAKLVAVFAREVGVSKLEAAIPAILTR